MCNGLESMCSPQWIANIFTQFAPTEDANFNQDNLDDINRKVQERRFEVEGAINETKRTILELKNEFQIDTSFNDLLSRMSEGFESLRKDVLSVAGPLSKKQKEEFDELLNPVIEELSSEIDKIPELRHTVEKCVRFKIPPKLAVTHPECVKFLLDSRVAGWILCYANSKPQEHAIRISEENGSPLFKFEGNWVAWEELEKIIHFDGITGKLVSKIDPQKTYIYISPQGFCEGDRFDYSEIFPVEQLEEEEVRKIQERAKLFFNKNEEVDPGIEKNNVFQLVTTFRDYGVPNILLTENLLHAAPQHASVRLIDSDGKAYSFGLEMKKEEMDSFSGALSILKTAVTKISSPDYEEPRNFTLKRITSIPLSDERFKNIIDFVNNHNKDGIRFNFLIQNCTKFSEEAMALTGYRVSARVSPFELVGRMLPPLEAIPVIGHPLLQLVNIINSIIVPILEMINGFIPQEMKAMITPILDVVMYVVRKIRAVALNLIILAFGGRQMHTPLPPGVEDNTENRERLATFSSLIRSPQDLLREDLFDLKYPLPFVDWQLNQESTVIYKDDGVKLYL